MMPLGYSKADKRLDTFGVIISLVLAVLGIVIMTSINNAKSESYDRSEDNPGYYYDAEATPELSDEGVTAVVNELYYTKGGHLYVYMTFGGGTNKDFCVEELDMEIFDAETGDLIAAEYTDDVDCVVYANDTETYIYYIDPDNVYIGDSTLENITYSITTTTTVLSVYG